MKRIIDSSVNRYRFVDEIHRFNKAQDAFLPYVEKGSIILIGATTEISSFESIQHCYRELRYLFWSSCLKTTLLNC